MDSPREVGLVGSAARIEDLGLSLAGKGFEVLAHAPAEAGPRRSGALRFFPDLGEMARAVSPPRRILVFLDPGEGGGGLLDQVLRVLAEGDIVVDGGDTPFQEAERMALKIESLGFKYMGVGAAMGTFMVGGDPLAYRAVSPIFKSIAAQGSMGRPCSTFVGPRGAGHYARMVFSLLLHGEACLWEEAASPRPGREGEEGVRQPILQWGIDDAKALGVAVPTLAAACACDAAMLGSDGYTAVSNPLLLSRICLWDQGLALLAAASMAYEYVFNPVRLLRLWQGASPLKSPLLETIVEHLDKGTDSLLAVPLFRELLEKGREEWSLAVRKAEDAGRRLFALRASLDYYESRR